MAGEARYAERTSRELIPIRPTHRCGLWARHPVARVPRVSSLLALAHRFHQLFGDGVVRDYAELARLGHVTRARLSQIVNVLNLAPAIQEDILFLPAVDNGDGGCGLPRYPSGSASTLRVSRLARRSHQITACCFAEPPSDPLTTKAPTVLLPPLPLRLLPAGATQLPGGNFAHGKSNSVTAHWTVCAKSMNG